MRIRDRIYGLETEFGAMIRTDDGKFLSVPSADAAAFFWFFSHAQGSINYLGRLWHTNGSLSYMDFNEHPEHATAECRSIRDLVACAKAGEHIMTDIFDASCPTMGNSRFVLFKNNLAFDDGGDIKVSFGCHENYFRPEDSVRGKKFEDVIIPFFMTRQIFDGAGWWDKNGKFLISQRAMMIRFEGSSGSATQARSFIHTKGSLDTGLGYRLHIIGGDSNILETATYLKVGVTSLILALIDNGAAPVLKCDRPLDALHAIAQTGDSHGRYVWTTNGEKLSALEVQYRYLEQARKYIPTAEFDSEATREESLHILVLWERALEAIDTNDIAWMIGRFDYVTKKYLFERQCSRMPEALPQAIDEARKNFDLYYHNVTDRTLQERMNAQWRSRRIVSDGEVLYMKKNPPVNTRAYLRAAFVSSALRQRDHICGNVLAWNYLSYRRNLAYRREILLQDPLCYSQSHEFSSFLKDMGDS